MGVCHDALHVELMRVIRAEAHSSGRVIYGCFRFAQPQVNHTTEKPAPSEIWIEDERPLNESGSFFEFAANISKGNARASQRDGVLPSQVGCLPSEPHGFGGLLDTIREPTAGLSLSEAPSRHAVGRGKTRIELNGTVEMRQSFLVALFGPKVKSGHAPQIVIVCVETLRGLTARPLNLGLLQLRSDGTNDTRCDLVL